MGEAETHSKVCSVACQDSSPSKEKRSSHSLVVSARSSLRTSHQCSLVKRLTVTSAWRKLAPMETRAVNCHVATRSIRPAWQLGCQSYGHTPSTGQVQSGRWERK